MIFTIKKISDLIWHHSEGFTNLTLSDFSIVINHTTQDIIIKEKNGAVFPQKKVEISDVFVVDQTTNGIQETGFTTFTLEARLEELKYIGLIDFVTNESISEAPNDGNIYGRKNLAWQQITSFGGTLNITTYRVVEVFNNVPISVPTNIKIIDVENLQSLSKLVTFTYNSSTNEITLTNNAELGDEIKIIGIIIN